MKKTVLGRTGIPVSVMGLGGGGPSRLGTRCGQSQLESIRVVHAALGSGINCFDTAESYGTESILGAALQEAKREDVVLCTKFHGAHDGKAQTLAQVEATLDRSLQNLKTDYIDVYMLHAVGARRYDAIAVPVVPSLLKMKEKGKIRAIGITECFGADRSHRMLRRALSDNWYDVVMVGFNLLNISAREGVLDVAQKNDVGVLGMFAVRRALRCLESFVSYLEKNICDGTLDSSAMNLADILRDIIQSGTCRSLSELAYRYCLSEPGIDCILSGTGSVAHLLENVRAVDEPPLSDEVRGRLERITSSWDHLSAQ